MFYKETDFKETSIGMVPKDWDVEEVNDIFEMYKGTTPSTRFEEFWNGEIPFVVPTDITALENSNKMYLERAEKYITEKGLKSKNLRLVPENSLLLTSRATIGSLAINRIKVTINQGIISLCPKKNADITFFFYLLQKLRPYLETLSGGSTFKEVSMSTFKDVKIVVPPFPEQRKIAEVLSVVNLAIQQTDELITKIELLKRGLMQELLARGIGHKEFKDTKIGKIPKKWEIIRLGDIAEVESGFGFPLEYQGRKSGKYPFIKVGDMNKFEKYLTSAENFVEEEDVKSLKAKTFPPNTIIFPKIGMAIYLNKFRMLKTWATFDNNVAGVIPKQCEPEFLFYYFVGKVDLKQLSSRTTAPSIRKTALESLMVPLPPPSEQQKIAEILSLTDEQIQLKKSEKTRLECVKHGLMNLLLTGKVRVKVA
jgi:type I restriction enzyme S subunit